MTVNDKKLTDCWFCRKGLHDDCLRRDHDGKLIPDSEEDCSCKICFGSKQ